MATKVKWDSISLKKENKHKLKVICAELGIKYDDYLTITFNKEVSAMIKKIREDTK